MRELEQGMISQITGVLGIFAKFIFAFVGGVNDFNVILENLSIYSYYRIIFITCLLGLIFFSVCFTLIYAKSKITEKKHRIEYSNRRYFVSQKNSGVLIFSLLKESVIFIEEHYNGGKFTDDTILQSTTKKIAKH